MEVDAYATLSVLTYLLAACECVWEPDLCPRGEEIPGLVDNLGVALSSGDQAGQGTCMPDIGESGSGDRGSG